METSGLGIDGREFKNAAEMWREQVGEDGGADNHKKLDWYRNGADYWQGVEASVDGVLGGYGHISDIDIKGSEAFLKSILPDIYIRGGVNQNLVALDCGAGIGRVTKNLLVRYFNEVDLVEPVSHFLEAARESLASAVPTMAGMPGATNFYCVPLQEFTPEKGRYDVIWIQWCIGHLTDDDLVAFFKRAKAGLKSGGFFILKENIARNGFVLDNEDRSVTRSDLYYKQLFELAGLHLYRTKDQRGFPEELFSVKMYALAVDLPKKTRITRPHTNRPALIK